MRDEESECYRENDRVGIFAQRHEISDALEERDDFVVENLHLFALGAGHFRALLLGQRGI